MKCKSQIFFVIKTEKFFVPLFVTQIKIFFEFFFEKNFSIKPRLSFKSLSKYKNSLQNGLYEVSTIEFSVGTFTTETIFV